MKDKLFWGAGVCYAISLFFVGKGFHKMYAYENPDSVLLTSINAYVGGDAYNYIINANYATAFFTLATFCALVGMTFIISALLYHERAINKTVQTKNNNGKSEQIPLDMI